MSANGSSTKIARRSSYLFDDKASEAMAYEREMLCLLQFGKNHKSI